MTSVVEIVAKLGHVPVHYRVCIKAACRKAGGSHAYRDYHLGLKGETRHGTTISARGGMSPL